MNKDRLPVVAVIPAFNEEQRIGGLLDQVLDQVYDDVYVLDDASTDHTAEAALAYGKDVHLFLSNKNLGSAANRNRIIAGLKQDVIIHFLDADVRLNSIDSPSKAREVISDDSVGMVGGLIRHSDGMQMPYNYGPKLSLQEIVSSWVYGPLYSLETRRPKAGRIARKFVDMHWSIMTEWPDPIKPHEPRDVYWCAEANTVIRSDVFAATGGYDSSLRYHETLDYSMRLEKLGLRRRFDPSLDVTHHAGPNILNNSSTKDFWLALAKISGRMGVKEFLSSR